MNSRYLLMSIAALILAGSATAQTAFKPSASLQAAVKAMPTQAGNWEIRRSDVGGGKPSMKCMTDGDWSITKGRALGLELVPPGCATKEVMARDKTVRTTFACEDRTLVEEWEFGEGSFRSRASETSSRGGKGETVESSGTRKGAC